MKAQVIKGDKQQIADEISRMSGDVREAIVFVEETADPESVTTESWDEAIKEMTPYMVDAPEIDDSRDSIYRRMDGE